jgi:hypothetical protein
MPDSYNEWKSRERLNNPPQIRDKTSQYQITGLAGQVKKQHLVDEIENSSQRYTGKGMMYVMFMIGMIILAILAYIALSGVEFKGWQTYIETFEAYWKQHQSLATTTFVIALIVNIFWIIVNTLIEYLSGRMQWIPELVQDSQTHSLQAKPEWIKHPFIPTYFYDEEVEQASEEETRKQEKEEDEAEYEAILDSPALSPLAFLWAGIKAVIRILQRFPRSLDRAWRKFLVWNEKAWWETKDWLGNVWELILYFINPINFVEEVLDVGIIILVRAVFPAILTPIIFFLPIRFNFVFTAAWQVIIYFLLIGGLRVGVEFYSIYVRYLRNERFQSANFYHDEEEEEDNLEID